MSARSISSPYSPPEPQLQPPHWHHASGLLNAKSALHEGPNRTYLKLRSDHAACPLVLTKTFLLPFQPLLLSFPASPLKLQELQTTSCFLTFSICFLISHPTSSALGSPSKAGHFITILQALLRHRCHARLAALRLCSQMCTPHTWSAFPTNL